MFNHDLKEKQVILVLTNEIVKELQPLGVNGSALVGKVHLVEDQGLWLDNPTFAACPINAPKLYDPKGQSFCHAHVFIPANSIISLVAFPSEVSHLEDQPGLHKIGFQPPGE